MVISFHKSLSGCILAVVVVAAVLGGCKGQPHPDQEASSATTGHDEAVGSQEPNSVRDLIAVLQQRLRDNNRDQVLKMIRFPVQVGEVGGIEDPAEFRRAYDKALLDEASFRRDYDRIWNPDVTKAVLSENPDEMMWPSGALAQYVGCGEVWFEKKEDGRFLITGFDRSAYRIAGISLRDCYRARDFLKELQLAIAGNKREQVAAMLRYPLRYHGEHKTITIQDARQTLLLYDSVFSASLRHAIAEQRVRHLIGRADGLGIERGYLWFNEPSENGEI